MKRTRSGGYVLEFYFDRDGNELHSTFGESEDHIELGGPDYSPPEQQGLRRWST